MLLRETSGSMRCTEAGDHGEPIQPVNEEVLATMELDAKRVASLVLVLWVFALAVYGVYQWKSRREASAFFQRLIEKVREEETQAIGLSHPQFRLGSHLHRLYELTRYADVKDISALAEATRSRMRRPTDPVRLLNVCLVASYEFDLGIIKARDLIPSICTALTFVSEKIANNPIADLEQAALPPYVLNHFSSSAFAMFTWDNCAIELLELLARVASAGDSVSEECFAVGAQVWSSFLEEHKLAEFLFELVSILEKLPEMLEHCDQDAIGRGIMTAMRCRVSEQWDHRRKSLERLLWLLERGR